MSFYNILTGGYKAANAAKRAPIKLGNKLASGSGGSFILNLNSSRIRELYKAEDRRGRKMRTIVGRTVTATGIGFATAGANFLVKGMQERQRDMYGDSKAVDALESSKSFITAFGAYQGILTLAGANPFQRIANIPSALRIKGLNKKRIARAKARGVDPANMPKGVPGTGSVMMNIGLTSLEVGTVGAILGGHSAYVGTALGGLVLGGNFAALGATSIAGGLNSVLSRTLGPVKALPITAAAGLGGYTSMYHVLPKHAEGNIIDFRRESATQRMNFSTAGLTFALRDQNRRVY